MFFIGVFGYNASLYDINVQVAGANALTPGQSQTGSTTTGSPAFFALQVRVGSLRTIVVCCSPLLAPKPLYLVVRC